MKNVYLGPVVCRHGRYVLMVLLCALVSSCQTNVDRSDKTHQEIQKSLEPKKVVETSDKSPRTAAPPRAVSAALMPKLSSRLTKKESDIDARFDIEVEDINVRDFFSGLVEGTSYNMVLDPRVEGTISLRMKHVTVREVMNVMRDVYGYDFKENKTSFLVLPATVQTRIFHINYLNVQRSGSSSMSVSSGGIVSSGGGGGGDSGGDSEGGASGGGASGGSSLSTTTSMDFWKELTTVLQAYIGDEAQSQVTVSPQAGIVIVKAKPEKIREIEAYLDAAQLRAQRQVILEAKIVEVELNDGFQSGINWGMIGRLANNKTVSLGQVGGTSIHENGFSDVRSTAGVLNPVSSIPIEGASTSAFGGVFTLSLALNDFLGFIELLETQGQVNVLSSPRVSTVNNQKAIIKIGQDEFFVTGLKGGSTAADGATTSSREIEIQPFFSGIALDVTPQISDNGEVILHIHPTVSEVTDETKTLTIDGQSQSIPLALSRIRESDSIVRAKNGQLIVLGGLMQTTSSKSDASVPVLSNLPIFGAMFKQQKDSVKKTELVILLKPTVVDDRNWEKAVEQSADTLSKFRGSQ